nr:PREDICTED: pro-MCH [Anolis carolinensis]|eukprot:XP_016849646.1 PREDICTED: pro-MCH [Anolis carolinensis]
MQTRTHERMYSSFYTLMLIFSLFSQCFLLSVSKSMRKAEDDMLLSTFSLGKVMQNGGKAENSWPGSSLEHYKIEDSNFLGEEENGIQMFSVSFFLFQAFIFFLRDLSHNITVDALYANTYCNEKGTLYLKSFSGGIRAILLWILISVTVFPFYVIFFILQNRGSKHDRPPLKLGIKQFPYFAREGPMALPADADVENTEAIQERREAGDDENSVKLPIGRRDFDSKYNYEIILI